MTGASETRLRVVPDMAEVAQSMVSETGESTGLGAS